MRGHVDPQAMMFSYLSPESRVPANHPLRPIKAHAHRVLKSMSRDFDELYALDGRPSIPPERLLKGQHPHCTVFAAQQTHVVRDARL